MVIRSRTIGRFSYCIEFITRRERVGVLIEVFPVHEEVRATDGLVKVSLPVVGFVSGRSQQGPLFRFLY